MSVVREAILNGLATMVLLTLIFSSTEKILKGYVDGQYFYRLSFLAFISGLMSSMMLYAASVRSWV